MMTFFSKQKPVEQTAPSTDYFAKAKSWADDRFTQNERSKARYQAAFFTSMGLNVAALLAVFALASTQTLVPMLVHHYDNGITTVDALNNKNTPVNRAQIESDIVRYVTNRESYDSSSYRAQFDIVTLLSSQKLSRDYSLIHRANNKESPINTLGDKYTRRVHVYNINFLDGLLANDEEIKGRKNHNNLAEVVFTITDIDKDTKRQASQSYNALVSWVYNKPSNSPELRWKNWDGFEMTRYTKQIRNDKA